MNMRRRLERLETLAAKRGDVCRSDTLGPLDSMTPDQRRAMTLDEQIAHDFGNDALERYKASTLGEQAMQMREWIKQIWSA